MISDRGGSYSLGMTQKGSDVTFYTRYPTVRECILYFIYVSARAYHGLFYLLSFYTQ